MSKSRNFLSLYKLQRNISKKVLCFKSMEKINMSITEMFFRTTRSLDQTFCAHFYLLIYNICLNYSKL